jgi:uncharacterized phage-like protein YoqJ
MKPDFLKSGYTLGITGHRPDAFAPIPAGAYAALTILKEEFETEPRPGLIISGLALGVDTWAAEAARRIHLPYVAAVPFEGQEKVWLEEDQNRYNQLKAAASRVVVVSEGGWKSKRDNWKFQKRNEWIVDNCDYLLAFLWRPGGTENCVRYGIRKDREMRVIDKTVLEAKIAELTKQNSQGDS